VCCGLWHPGRLRQRCQLQRLCLRVLLNRTEQSLHTLPNNTIVSGLLSMRNHLLLSLHIHLHIYLLNMLVWLDTQMLVACMPCMYSTMLQLLRRAHTFHYKYVHDYTTCHSNV
jgi:hypothetical protein